MTMQRLTEIEECIVINTREMSALWSVLADWTSSEDEELWVQFEPLFASVVTSWVEKEYLEIYEGPEWPAYEKGRLIPVIECPALLADHEAWVYSEHPVRVISLFPGVKFGDVLDRL
ncbi:hypothetical protein ACFV13_05780 [Streptomyces bauhiniae]|uniref:hypothetical protein n=1 Tax=Streptomyces bauhiniae TaxID=2340725 RepID=UPI00368EDDA2